MQAKQGFEQDGYSFALTDMLRQEMPEHQSRAHTETVTVNSKSKDLTAILPLLAETKSVTTEDGFTGTLHLNTDSIKVEPAGYKNNSWTVSATRTYPNLSDMDLEFIPKTTTENGRKMCIRDRYPQPVQCWGTSPAWSPIPEAARSVVFSSCVPPESNRRDRLSP